MLSQVTIEELGKSLAGPRPPAIIDVREAEEYSAGHVKGALSVPLANLAKFAMAKFKNRSQPLVVYCDTGIRSHHAARLLRSLGFKSVKEIDHGMTGADFIPNA